MSAAASRAVPVVRYLLVHSGVAADRLTASGRADSQPLAPNDTEENRALNRRVEISFRAG